MTMAKRAFIIVCDSFGIGGAPDAKEFGDAGANTLASIVKSEKYDTPLLKEMGLFNIVGVDCAEGVEAPTASFARIQEASMGKDTTIGHWEIAGIISDKPLPTFPNGFPREFMEKFEAAVGRKTVCNLPYSGTEALKDFGEHHLKTGDLIIYTSADSVFQVAAHESLVPVEELYRICDIAREMLTESGECAVGRVIARPFLGDSADTFKRTTNRHDVSLEPPKKTMLDCIREAGQETIGVGKIYDIFAGIGVSEKIKSAGNDNGMEITIDLADRDFEGLAFINLVDFDMVFGHRRDIDGYADCATRFDRQLAEFLPKMKEDDLLIITADHGCDPGYTQTTDHTRECIPMIAYGPGIKAGVDLGTLTTYADIAQTVCEHLGVPSSELAGTSFLGKIKK